MKRLALLGALMLWAAPADAHRLDEYLQQTLLEVEPERVVLHVDLTPGVAVASSVIRSIDTDGDGALSTAEQSAYAEAVRRDLSLSLKGRELPLRVRAVRYPAIAEMNTGAGTIALTLEALVTMGPQAAPNPGAFQAPVTMGPQAAPNPGSAALELTNHHAPVKSAYLVNCLMPRPPVRVLAQSRNQDQSSYRVDLQLGAPEAPPPARERATAVVALIFASLAGAWLLWRATQRGRGAAAAGSA